MDSNGVASIKGLLESLIASLNESLGALKTDPVHAHLDAILHNDATLPAKKVVALASEAIDLLHQIEQFLEPSHLVLADHFLVFKIQSSQLSCAHSLYSRRFDTLARASKARPDRLCQILRPLYNNGIFSFDNDSMLYANNRTSHLLRSDEWTQWRNWVDLYGNEFYDIARGIPASVKEDAIRSGAQINFDTNDDMFTYFQAQGWLPRLHRTLGGGASAMAPGILADYPWDEVADKTVLDIGGGGGALIASLLRKHETMRGGILDLPSVIDHTTPFFSPGGQYADLSPRVPRENLIPGDFLQSIPSFEVYIMKWVLHDWKDPDAVIILQNIRKAITPGPKSRLVVLESVLADGRMGRLSRYGDINMMMTAKGQERTEVQWMDLADRAGWSVTGIFHLRNSWVQAIELKI